MSPDREIPTRVEREGIWHDGGCHCGAVRYQVFLPDEVKVTECNCSICSRSGYLHAIVTDEQFRLLKGEDKLTSYRFNTGTADHLFCGICGIKSFYRPRSHPEGWSVNLRCLDPDEFTSINIEAFDGRHWEENIAAKDRQEPIQ